jgi:hypothetical protein
VFPLSPTAQSSPYAAVQGVFTFKLGVSPFSPPPYVCKSLETLTLSKKLK